MKRFFALTAFSICAGAAQIVSAGPEPIAADNSKVVLQSEMEIPRIAPWFGVEASGGDGMGTDDGLLTVEAFLPVWQNRNNLLYSFARGILSHNFDDDDPFRADNSALQALAEEVTSTCPDANRFRSPTRWPPGNATFSATTMTRSSPPTSVAVTAITPKAWTGSSGSTVSGIGAIPG